MFCSNCSSILRSRRRPTAEESTPKKVEDDATRRIPVTTAVKPETEVPKPNDWEDKFATRKRPAYRAPAPAPARETIPTRKNFYDEFEDTREERETKVKFCSAWCNVLSVVSWVIFLVLIVVGVVGGAALIIMGLKDGEAMFYFGGAAVMILFVITALAYHARNMVQIKILRKFNERK